MPSGNHPQNQKRRRRIRDTSEVSCCLKYVIFGFNVIFWVSYLDWVWNFSWRIWIQLLGLGILAIGIWAWSEKDTFNNLSKLTNIALDPAFIFIWAGAITFIIGLCPICSVVLPNYCFCLLFSLKTLPFAGFTGCVGALRENTTLLAAYAIFLAILLLLEVQPHI